MASKRRLWSYTRSGRTHVAGEDGGQEYRKSGLPSTFMARIRLLAWPLGSSQSRVQHDAEILVWGRVLDVPMAMVVPRKCLLWYSLGLYRCRVFFRVNSYSPGVAVVRFAIPVGVGGRKRRCCRVETQYAVSSAYWGSPE